MRLTPRPVAPPTIRLADITAALPPESLTPVNGDGTCWVQHETPLCEGGHMKRWFRSKLFKIGFWMFVIGSGPLLLIILLATLGLWPDPNPNPIGPGLMAFLTFWPSIILMIIGAISASRQSD